MNLRCLKVNTDKVQDVSSPRTYKTLVPCISEQVTYALDVNSSVREDLSLLSLRNVLFNKDSP